MNQPNNCVLPVALILSIAGINSACVYADGPADNQPDNVRPVPPVGIEISETDRSDLEQGFQDIYLRIEQLKSVKAQEIIRLIPDVEIFARAIRDGVTHRELFSERDVANARLVLAEGKRRATALLDNNPYWLRQTGLVVRGYRSKIDRTVQPYGLVIPDNYSFDASNHLRLDLWFHGRGERSSESVFIAERMQRIGRFAPKDTIVLHPYGRYSNAFKFAGEIDVLEALEHAKQHYRIDEDRISVRGFSMGGAGCWQMAVHYPDLFFAANPGAGFSETPEFLTFFQKETVNPTWYEKKLWQLYDCPGYAVNLSQLPTVAYSGELDIQKQAADVMQDALQRQGIRLMHVIGSQTQHTIDDASKKIIETKLNSLAKTGRNRTPHEIHFATYTLKYNRCHWLTVTALREHWKQARVDAKIDSANALLTVDTSNVQGFRIEFKAGDSPFAISTNQVKLVLNGTREQRIPGPFSDGSFSVQIDSHAMRQSERVKKHDLQGPIDDAFMDSFIVVSPTGTEQHPQIADWAESEQRRLVREWRRQFRGDAIMKADVDITDDDIETNHLVLFGEPTSNSVIGRIADQLPVKWQAGNIVIGDQRFDAATHAPVMIYPNPLNPDRYVVLNSGFTYREFAYLNNARQVPKLPDWAIVNVGRPANSLWPGEIVAADFFDEEWGIKVRMPAK